MLHQGRSIAAALRQAIALAVFALIVAAASPPRSVAPFQMARVTPLGAAGRNGASRGLNLDPISALNAEEVTVYARRHLARPPSATQNPTAFGPVVLSGGTATGRIGFSGMTVSASVAVPGVPGLEAVANLSGGREAVNASNTTQSAALTAGLRLKF